VNLILKLSDHRIKKEDWERFGKPLVKLFPALSHAYSTKEIIEKSKEFYKLLENSENFGNK
jgi:hypothetical protein